VVERAAGDGSGPPAGTRVAGLVSRGAWAQLAAVPVDRMAPVPAGVPDVQAATFPTAGLTALRALEVGGLVLGRRVPATGAAGGVGRLGAAAVVEDLGGDFDVIIDGVGGATFGLAIEHLAPRGVLVNIATRDEEEMVSFRAGRFDRARGAAIYTLNLPDELAAHASAASDLTRLCALAAGGRLDGQIELECSWRQPGPAIDALLNRRMGGKAVLISTDRQPGEPLKTTAAPPQARHPAR
jgi:NADPH:quinone reductase